MLNVISGTLSAGAPPVSPTSYESISTVTVGGGGASSISFTSIPSTYKHLEIRGIGQINTGTEYALVRFNSDSGANYSIHYLNGSGAAASAGAATSSNQAAMFYGMGMPSTANTFGAGVCAILDYADTNKYKTVRSLDGFDANGSGGIELCSSSWRNTAAITSISLTPNSSKTFNQYSSFALYGIKG